MKKDFYQQKRDAEDRYEDAIESQKVKKMSYDLLLGKFKHKNSLKEWQENNKKLEQKVTKGTETMKAWNMGEANVKPVQAQGTYYVNNEEDDIILHKFTQHNSARPLHMSRYG